MDREEILKKAQSEKKDEMVERTRDKAMKYTYEVLAFSAAVFAFFRGQKGQPVMDLCATVCYSIFAGRIYCYSKTKDRFDLIMAVVMIITAVFATVRFFMGH